ncbi:hypothetical protein [Sporosarcina sp. G11-34]|uniref:hypothetical protein n=1 Tax=Sporosarcina sp. G11-34 TaxID=2849605 RepID=UPI0022A8F3C8|nr:hypothetical protein [Sporosarcina sp. G11-34]MCZ2257301.1 hypothetical protein [Sporosarcina sp. G11-34]
MVLFLLAIEGLLFFILKQMFEGLNTNLYVISTIIVAVNSLLFLVTIGRNSKNKGEYLILFFAYIARLFILYFDIFGRDIFILPNSGYDSEMYNGNAMNFVNGDGSGRGGFYSIILGYIYMMFGEQRIVAQYFNVILSMYSIFIVKKILEQLMLSTKVRVFVLILFSFIPNYLIMSSILLRESIMIFLLTYSFYFFIRWWKNGSSYNLLIAIALPIVTSIFHSGGIAPAVGYVICYIFYDRLNQKYRLNLSTIFSGAFFLLLFFVVNTFFGDMLFGKFKSVDSITDLSKTASTFASGGSSYSIGINANSIPSIIIYTPIRVLYFIASPLPWDWRGFNDIFAFVFSGLFYLLSYLFVFRVLIEKNIPQRSLLIASLIVAVSSVLLFAWGVSNAGTALRHREKFIGIYMVMFALSLNIIKLKRRSKKKI